MSSNERVERLLGHLSPTNSALIIPQDVSQQEDDQQSKHGGILVARALYKAGIRYLFTLSGGHISPILVGCKKEGITVIDVRDEVAAVFAADAMSRLTGITGVAAVTAGPGLTNTITAVKNAQLAESPIIVIGGATAMLLKNRGSLQDIDQHELMAPHCKRTQTIKSLKSIWSELELAFEVANSDVPGPVFVEIPLEVLYPESIITPQMIPNKEPPPFSFQPAKLKVKLQDMYIRRHVKKVYGSGSLFEEDSIGFKYRVYRIPAVPAVVNAGLKELVKSKRPLFILGSQAARVGETDILVHSLETLGVPVFLSGMCRGMLGVSHPLLLRHKRREAIEAADCVFVIGTAIDFRLQYGKQFNKQAFVAMVNFNADSLERNKDIRSRQLSCLADPIFYVRELAASWRQAAPTVDYSNWLNECKERDQERENDIARMIAQNSSTEEGVHPLFLCSKINEALDDDSVIVADGGDFVGTASYTVYPKAPLSWLDPGVFGTLGVGGGMAVAAKIARPKSEVWLLYGDGSSAYSLAEIDTCVRHGLPIIAVIGNDAAWMQILRDQQPLLGDGVGCVLRPHTRYDTVAEGYGGEGIYITSSDQVVPGLQRAKELAKQGKPVVVNCILTKSTFREGSISI